MFTQEIDTIPQVYRPKPNSIGHTGGMQFDSVSNIELADGSEITSANDVELNMFLSDLWF
jgi:hypothetical protein